MPDVNELRRFLKADMVINGDKITFMTAGTISEKEFGKEGEVKKKNTVLEMEVIINNNPKKVTYSPNATSVGLLKEKWGSNTDGWVGKVGVVSIIEQLSFGKLTNVLIVKPFNTNITDPSQVDLKV